MFKKTLMLAVTAIAVTAAIAPMASANWTHSGVKIPAGTNPALQGTGQGLFTSAVVGGVNCQALLGGKATGGSTTGALESAGVDLSEAGSTTTSKCVTSGPIAVCRVKEVIATNLPWTIHSNGADSISITTGEIDIVLESQSGGACGVVQQIKLKAGTITATIPAGETSAVKQVTLSGTLQTQSGSNVTIGGTLSATPSGTYGTA